MYACGLSFGEDSITILKQSLGFVRPNFPGEKRVSLLPEHVSKCWGPVIMERGFGGALGLDDESYVAEGVRMLSREEVFFESDFIYSLKLLHPDDYESLRPGSSVIGWTHPQWSGKRFFETVCQERDISVFDLDSKFPALYRGQSITRLSAVPSGFVDGNSRLAGLASVQHAFLSMGIVPSPHMKIAVLAVGDVSQGALSYLYKFSPQIDVFTRSNMASFMQKLPEYDVVVNGAQLDEGHLVRVSDLKRMKKGALIVDAAADSGGAIESSSDTTIEDPLFERDGVFHYGVPNSPSLLFREASAVISEAFSTFVYSLHPSNLVAGAGD